MLHTPQFAAFEVESLLQLFLGDFAIHSTFHLLMISRKCKM